jgi:hypothetical protein
VLHGRHELSRDDVLPRGRAQADEVRDAASLDRHAVFMNSSPSHFHESGFFFDFESLEDVAAGPRGRLHEDGVYDLYAAAAPPARPRTSRARERTTPHRARTHSKSKTKPPTSSRRRRDGAARRYVTLSTDMNSRADALKTDDRDFRKEVLEASRALDAGLRCATCGRAGFGSVEELGDHAAECFGQ